MNTKSTLKEQSNHSVSADSGSDFANLGLAPILNEAVRAAGYREPTPIQQQAIPVVVSGRDILGSAQTGTGKTAAFALPILHRLLASREATETGASREARRTTHAIRTLVLAPTRELAAQIGESFRKYGKGTHLRCEVVFGGVSKFHQVKALRKGVDILVATPGRLLDLIGDREVNLREIEIFVLDEADRMLDMGFIDDVRRIIKLVPQQRQTLLFSATLPGEIQELANSVLHRPVRVSIAPRATDRAQIEDVVYRVNIEHKLALLLELLRDAKMDRVLVFTRTKHGADRVAKNLDLAGIAVSAIHGNKSQAARERVLAEFKQGRTHVVVATDIAARGIDVKGLSHVVNFDVPLDPESYVHRIGRTGRAGESGVAITFCASSERTHLKAIERLLGRSIPRLEAPEGLEKQAEIAREAERETGPKRDRAPRRDRDRAQGDRHKKESDGGLGRRAGQARGRSADARHAAPSESEDAAREQRPSREKRAGGFAEKRERSSEPRREGFAGKRREGFGARRSRSDAPHEEREDFGSKRERPSGERAGRFGAKRERSGERGRDRSGEEREGFRGRSGEPRDKQRTRYTEERHATSEPRREGFGARRRHFQEEGEGFAAKRGRFGAKRHEAREGSAGRRERSEDGGEWFQKPARSSGPKREWFGEKRREGFGEQRESTQRRGVRRDSRDGEEGRSVRRPRREEGRASGRGRDGASSSASKQRDGRGRGEARDKQSRPRRDRDGADSKR